MSKKDDGVVELLRECASSAHGLAQLRRTLGVSTEACWQQRCLGKVADEIEARYMKLPVDADGVPIRLGDTLEIERGGSKDIGEVSDLHLQEGKCAVSICFEYDSGVTAYPEDYRHVKPETVESLLEDMVKDIASEHVIYVPNDRKDEFGARLRDIRDDYAERIKKAVEHGQAR